MTDDLPDNATVMEERPEDVASFLNVDLDIEAPYDLAPLVAALGEQIFDLYTGPVDDRFEAHLELHTTETFQRTNPEVVIQAFITLLDHLPPEAKLLWDGATRRDFNIGLQSGKKPPRFECALLPQTLASISRLGAGIVLTVYPVEDVETKF